MARVLAGLAGVGLVLGLAWLYGAARFDAGRLDERARWERASVEATVADATEQLAFERELMRARLAGEVRVRQAAERYAANVGELAGSALNSERETEAYAATPHGGELCLAPDRVRSILDADAWLGLVLAPARAPEPPGAAGGAPRDLLAPLAGPVG